MFVIIVNQIPRSVNAAKCSMYKGRLLDAMKESYPDNRTNMEYEMYSIVYYFHKRPTQLDADNLSKPVCDAFEGYLYDDDKVVNIRYSGIFNLMVKNISALDITNIPADKISKFLDLISTEKNILYIEFGKSNNSFFRFGIEND